MIWRHRGERRAGDPAALAEEVAGFALPPGQGHAYLAGEARLVQALREILTARGMEPGQLSPKAYWGRGKANAPHGEPPRDDS